MDIVWVGKEKLADEKTLKRAVASLKNNNIEAVVVENGKDAMEKVLELLPEGVEVMTMSSLTLDTIGVTKKNK